MRYGVLGPLRVTATTGPVVVASGLQRALLAALLARPGRTVGVDALVEAVWPERPPRRAVDNVRWHLHHLRKAIGKGSIRNDHGGYLIDGGAAVVDAHEFRDLLGRARTCATNDPGQGRAAYRDALALWRGRAFEDCREGEPMRAEAESLDGLRLDAIEEAMYIDLALRQYADVYAQTALARAHPLRERMQVAVVTALARSGRQAEALALFDRIRRALASELGVDPGPELVDLHRQLLRGDDRPRPGQSGRRDDHPRGAPKVVVRQLPTDVMGFVGRAAALATLDGLLDDAGGIVHGIAVVSGTAGVGKSTLAVHWAHRVRSRFPDGELYTNLRGYDADGLPVEAHTALRGFLGALGVADRDIPAEPDAQVSLYRSVLANRRMLIVADNVREAAQVLPLIPGTPACLVLVTSRDQLEPLLVVTGGVAVPLALLSADESRQLLEQRLGPDRLADAPNAVIEIIRACARLPLALAITAGRATVHTGYTLDALAEDLTAAAGPLEALTGGSSQVDVRSVLSWSYHLLDPDTARLFRQLSLYPGPEIGLTAVASLAGVPVSKARGMLRELTRGNLIEEPSHDRYAFHDLLREYAREKAARHDSPAATALAHRRLLDHYVATAQGAAQRISPRPRQQLLLPSNGVIVVPLSEVQAAIAWFARERLVLRDAIDQAGRHGFDEHAWQLADALARFFERQGNAYEWITTLETGVAAAERLGDPVALGCCLTSVGCSYGSARRYDEAEAAFLRAMQLLQVPGGEYERPRAHKNLSHVLGSVGRMQDAMRHSTCAAKLYADIDDNWGVISAINATAMTHSLCDQPAEAIAECLRALAIAEEHDLVWKTANVFETLGSAYRLLGDLKAAQHYLERGVEIARGVSDRYAEAWLLRRLGELLLSTAPQPAHAAWQRAIDILDKLGHPAADEIRAQSQAA